MGYYTQIRGWLNVDSIQYKYADEHFNKVNSLVKQAQKNFMEDDSITRDDNGEKLEYKSICKNTFVHSSGNGSIFIFFGTEGKNQGYGNPMEKWIEYLLKYFPNAEGRVDFQYENDEDYCKYWLIFNGEVLEESENHVWCTGYGNSLPDKYSPDVQSRKPKDPQEVYLFIANALKREYGDSVRYGYTDGRVENANKPYSGAGIAIDCEDQPYGTEAIVTIKYFY